MTNKAHRLLACLMDARGRSVTHSEILARVWPDTHVHPDNIKVLIREIRVALEDDSRNPRYIRSDRGCGYSYVGPTSEPQQTVSAEPVTTTWRGSLSVSAPAQRSHGMSFWPLT
jgi:DNA-binding winged helix-turn-helix (wHTH) protein